MKKQDIKIGMQVRVTKITDPDNFPKPLSRELCPEIGEILGNVFEVRAITIASPTDDPVRNPPIMLSYSSRHWFYPEELELVNA